jgi:hypothetical protein
MMNHSFDYTDIRLLGMELLTDYEPLCVLLKMNGFDQESLNRDSVVTFDVAFPGLMEAIMEGHKELAYRRLRPSLVTYFNFRVQVWALGFDADPSAMKRCLPAGIVDEQTHMSAE